MRRLPIYFLIDVSESMVGEPIAQVENGMRTIIQELRSDPYALETAFVGIVIFAGRAQLLSPLTEVYTFYPPVFPIGSGTALGEGLRALMHEIDSAVQKTTAEKKGDWKPLVFLFTDGAPTDQPDAAIAAWNAKYRSRCTLVAISLGNTADVSRLHALTENVLRLTDTTPDAFKQFFKWVTASIKTASASIAENNSADDAPLPPADGIRLEKSDGRSTTAGQTDDNFAILLAKCSTHHKPYLIKYARRARLNFDEVAHGVGFDYSAYHLVGAYPVDEQQYQKLSGDQPMRNHISSTSLVSSPACPCCGNQLGMVLCQCGGIFCARGSVHTIRCPWCGAEGSVGETEESLDFSRRQG